jgi:hypothetical protein
MSNSTIQRYGGVLILLISISACEQKPILDHPGAFTLSTGVSIMKVDKCVADDAVGSLKLDKDGADYIVSAKGFFDCSDDMKDAYLTVGRDGKSTLVLGSTSRKSGCECSRAVRVKVADRLEPGETLYVLGDGEVIGHLDVPRE